MFLFCNIDVSKLFTGVGSFFLAYPTGFYKRYSRYSYKGGNAVKNAFCLYSNPRERNSFLPEVYSQGEKNFVPEGPKRLGAQEEKQEVTEKVIQCKNSRKMHVLNIVEGFFENCKIFQTDVS